MRTASATPLHIITIRLFLIFYLAIERHWWAYRFADKRWTGSSYFAWWIRWIPCHSVGSDIRPSERFRPMNRDHSARPDGWGRRHSWTTRLRTPSTKWDCCPRCCACWYSVRVALRSVSSNRMVTSLNDKSFSHSYVWSKRLRDRYVKSTVGIDVGRSQFSFVSFSLWETQRHHHHQQGGYENVGEHQPQDNVSVHYIAGQE